MVNIVTINVSVLKAASNYLKKTITQLHEAVDREFDVLTKYMKYIFTLNTPLLLFTTHHFRHTFLIGPIS
jgi:hypothetical protein